MLYFIARWHFEFAVWSVAKPASKHIEKKVCLDSPASFLSAGSELLSK